MLGIVKAGLVFFGVFFAGSPEKRTTEQANRETFMFGAAGIHTHTVSHRLREKRDYFVWRENPSVFK